MREFRRVILKKIKDMKFRHKLIGTFFVIGIIPMLALGIFSYTQTKKLLVQQEENNIHDFITQSAMSMDNQLQIYNNLSDYIAYNQTISQVISYDYDNYYDMYDQFTTVLDPMLASVKYFNDDVNKLTVYTRNDIVKHDTTLAPISEIEGKSWFEQVMADSNRTNKWVVDEENKTAFSVRKMPLLEDLDSRGVLYINVDYNKLFDSFCQMSSGNYGVYIFDDDGNTIYSYHEFEDDANDLVLDEKQLYEEKEKADNGDKTNYAIVEDETSLGWRVVLYKPNKAINNSIFSIIILIVVVTICCILVSSAISAYLSRVMVNDIEKLTNNMNEVEAGNMEITVTSDARDEIGNLIRGFGNMITRINQLINEVYKGKISQKESEMKALQAQINPHFLYNSLSLINWKALETNQQDISRLTLLLSTFYRTALNRGKNILSIRDELSNMKSYMDIQLMMHDEAFEVVVDFDEELMEYSTLNLLLQPLVENAIDHGIDMLEEGNGIISIIGRSDKEDILMTVSDNGVGMSKEQAEKILTLESKGYGVRNVQERIVLFYGAEYGLTVDSEEGAGTSITIRIPKRKM